MNKQVKDINVTDAQTVKPTTYQDCQKTVFDIKYQKFFTTLDLHTKELIKHLEPLCVYPVKVKFGENRYELKFTNSYYIKIPKYLYDLFPVKESVKLSNI